MAISMIVQPKLQTSARFQPRMLPTLSVALETSFRMTSGAIQRGLPLACWALTVECMVDMDIRFADPKSASLIVPSSATSKLSALISRCAMPASCRVRSP